MPRDVLFEEFMEARSEAVCCGQGTLEQGLGIDDRWRGRVASAAVCYVDGGGGRTVVQIEDEEALPRPRVVHDLREWISCTSRVRQVGTYVDLTRLDTLLHEPLVPGIISGLHSLSFIYHLPEISAVTQGG